jgi:hypothetical protein
MKIGDFTHLCKLLQQLQANHKNFIVLKLQFHSKKASGKENLVFVAYIQKNTSGFKYYKSVIFRSPPTLTHS